MRGRFKPSLWLRRPRLGKSLGGGELLPDELVDRFTVDALACQLRHGGLHDPSHVFRRGSPCLLNSLGNGALDGRRIGCRREVGVEYKDFRGFLVREILAPALRELFDGILALLDERRHHLKGFGLVQRAAAFHLAIHQGRFHHAKRGKPNGITLAHRVGDGGVQIRNAGHVG